MERVGFFKDAGEQASVAFLTPLLWWQDVCVVSLELVDVVDG